ncbi:MAG: type II toxin-antitoxin system RelE/ParE family toxin [Saccharofermentanales bacterium]
MSNKRRGIFYESSSGSSPVEEWLNSTSLRVRTKLIKMMIQVEEYWGHTHLPFVKPVREDLFEITTQVDGKWPRVLFFCYDQDSIVYLHGFFKKMNKTPKNEIAVALDRKIDFYSRQEEKI